MIVRGTYQIVPIVRHVIERDNLRVWEPRSIGRDKVRSRAEAKVTNYWSNSIRAMRMIGGSIELVR